MIIGNNNNGNNFNKDLPKENNSFKKGANFVENNQNKTHNPFVEDIKTMQHSNPTDRIEMRDKSLAMLQERLENGTISLEEFHKKVNLLNKNK